MADSQMVYYLMLFKCWCTWFALLLSWFEIYVLLFSLQGRLIGVDCLVDQVLDRVIHVGETQRCDLVSLKTDFRCGKACWKLFTSVFETFLAFVIYMNSLFAVCGASMLQEVFWKEWFHRTVVIPKAVEIVCSGTVACARNVRIRTMAAAGIAREFGLKDSEIRVATMQSQTWPCWCFYVNDFTVPPGVYWSTRQWK